MRAISKIAMALILLTGAAFAGDEVMASRFGNTTVITTAAGGVIKIWYEADHTLTFVAGGQTSHGTWALEGAMLCVSVVPPPEGMAAKVCNPFALHNVGESWTVGEGDRKLSVTLLAGHQ